jgi:phosphatidylinositol glycan class M
LTNFKGLSIRGSQNNRNSHDHYLLTTLLIMTFITTLLRPLPLFTIASLLRLTLLLYGLHQDASSAIKYTDIDYLVFTDASRFVSRGQSPYARDTYRYTPLLAWLLLPTAYQPQTLWFSFGKVVFALADLLAGWLILSVLRRDRAMSETRAGAFAALWLWNPMVATISTRGSSEGLLGVLTIALLWAVERRRLSLAAVLLGLGVHFKIYPFIYAVAIVWWMDDEHLIAFLSVERIQLAFISLSVFMSLNILMYFM